MKCPYKGELAFPEFEDVPNSQMVSYSYSSSFLDTTKKKKKRKEKSNRQKNKLFWELTFKIQFGLNTIWILIAISLYWTCRSSHPERFFKNFIKFLEFKEICKKTFMLESLLGWRPANLLKRDSRTGVFRWVLQKKLRTIFWQDTSEWPHLNLSQPKVLKYLLTALQSNRAFKNYFICCLISNFKGVFRTLSNI